MLTILVAPDPDERDILTYILRHGGLSIAASLDLGRVRQNWLERPADLVVIASNQPEAMLENIRELRQMTQVPILLLSDLLAEQTHLALLQAGVDLVMIRPISPKLLIEYTRVMLRRTRTMPDFVLPKFDLDAINLDPTTRTVTVAGREPCRLTQLEFRLLYVLMVNRGQVVPVDVIVERVWGYTGQGSRELVRGLVSRLRRKIEPGDDDQFIQNVPGVGYQFTVDDGR